MQSPTPTPRTTMKPAVSTYEVVLLSSDNRKRPTPINTVPMIGNTRYRPVLLITWPTTIDATSRPPTSGSICSPDSVAEAPCTNCRYVGRYVTPPSIANPMMKLMIEQTVKTPDRNNRNGSKGSAARRSAQMNNASASTEPAIIARMTVEPHAYSLPPHVVTSVSPVAAAPMNKIPR